MVYHRYTQTQNMLTFNNKLHNNTNTEYNKIPQSTLWQKAELVTPYPLYKNQSDQSFVYTCTDVSSIQNQNLHSTQNQTYIKYFWSKSEHMVYNVWGSVKNPTWTKYKWPKIKLSAESQKLHSISQTKPYTLTYKWKK